MPTTPSPPEPSEPELSVEPVMGWRVWRLAFSNGRYRLRSATQEMLWQPGEAFRATCVRRTHPAPEERCSCGVYGTSSPRRLALSSALSSGVNVVGVIAMWGRVIEHARGARSAAAYPARIRLVCGRCLSTHRGPVEAVAVVPDSGFPVVVCRRHLPEGRVGLSPAEVEAQLLDDYGVELLPIERLTRELRHRVPIEPMLRAFDTRPPAHVTARLLARAVPVGLVLLSALAVLLSVTLALVWVVSGWS